MKSFFKPYIDSFSQKNSNLLHLILYALSVGSAMLSNFILVFFLVRILNAEDYGSLALIKNLFLIIISLGGVGLSQAAVRWAPIYKKQEKVLSAVLGAVCLSAVPSIFFMILFVSFLNINITIDFKFSLSLSLLTFLYLLNNEFINWRRANQFAKSYAFASTFRVVLQLIVIFLLVKATKSISSYVLGLLFSELIVFLWFFNDLKKTPKEFDKALIIDMVKYGWPHSIVIASSLLLNYGDRYVLSSLTHNNALVAYYDVTFTMVASVMGLLTRPLNLFLFPKYTKCYESEGEVKTVFLLKNVQKNYLLFGTMLASVLISIKAPLFHLLFPEQYSKLPSIVVVLICYSVLLGGLNMITVAGLNLAHKTILVALSILIALSSNFFLNFILIPYLGVIGAALSAVVSSFVQLCSGAYLSRSFIKIKLPKLSLFFIFVWLCVLNLAIN